MFFEKHGPILPFPFRNIRLFFLFSIETNSTRMWRVEQNVHYIFIFFLDESQIQMSSACETLILEQTLLSPKSAGEIIC